MLRYNQSPALPAIYRRRFASRLATIQLRLQVLVLVRRQGLAPVALQQQVQVLVRLQVLVLVRLQVLAPVALQQQVRVVVRLQVLAPVALQQQVRVLVRLQGLALALQLVRALVVVLEVQVVVAQRQQRGPRQMTSALLHLTRCSTRHRFRVAIWPMGQS